MYIFAYMLKLLYLCRQMKGKLFIILLFFCHLSVWGSKINTIDKPEKHHIDIDYRISVRAGGIMPDGKADVMLGQKNQWITPSIGTEVAIAFHPDWQALHEWNDASIGIALSCWYLGNQSLLGYAVSPYVYMDIPLVRIPHFILGIRPGIGAGFMTKTYRNTIPNEHLFHDMEGANRSIGSVFNFHFPEALYVEFPIINGWSILASGGWYHFSNGSMVQPNSGYNIFAGEVGARYTPVTNQPLRPAWSKNADGRRKNWEVEFAFTGGGRQVYYKDRQTFFVAEIQAAAYWRAHNIFRLGGGLDVFYDGAYTQRSTEYQKTYLNAARASDCWRMGVSLQPEFVVGHFTAGFHLGIYLLDPVKEMEPYIEAKQSETGRLHKGVFYSYDLLNAGSAGYPDGWLYTQIVLRYRLPWHLFIQANMKAHLTKVEFVGLGIGAWL